MKAMAGNKKPAKKYRQREVVKPLNIRNVWETEGDVHAALLAMEGGALDGVHIAHLAAHAQIMMNIHKEGPVHIQSKSMIRMIKIIASRPDMHVTRNEELPIRAAVKVTLPALISASNLSIYRASTKAMHVAEKNGGYL